MTIENLRVSPGIVTADVDGEHVVLAAPPIASGIWAEVDVSASNLAQTLEHTWEEELLPRTPATTGPAAAVATVREAIEADRALLLRWRGYGKNPSGGEFAGAPLPPLPVAERRPPDSVPKRFGAAGIPYAGDDIVEAFVRVYDGF